MELTAYHAKYFAHELTRRRASDSVEKLASALVDAQVDLNPHQVEAALFAFRSPLSKGAILADEVGLGKTIEAGLVISQRWAERKRRVLVITPSNLRKQWHQELSEKFFLPCRILESKPYNEAIREGRFRPFESDAIVICSYQFARAKAGDINAIPWDLVVIDEAHRLRNVYKPSNVIANTLKGALAHAPKLLLTATPLQNSLLELFGLVSFVDEHAFGDLASFREQFADLERAQVFQALKARLKPVCHRTLRRQVLAYVRYTKRLPIMQPFTPEEGEDRLYHLVSEYLQRGNLYALPASQRSLITLVLRKLLASSTFAIAGALESMSKRLHAQLKKHEPAQALEDELDRDYEALGETAEEWSEDPPEPLSEADRAAIEREIADLESFRALAVSIIHNAKGVALLKALDIAFAKAADLGAAQKAIIFTESRRTQEYLLRVLADSPWREGIVLFNGTNTDERSRALYAEWFERHQGTDRVSGSRTADMRSALVDYFREQGRIMIATEAGAEGINLQFCALVVNYDLPWNPQRIEQRIGRCHRYGQQHDVVVVNFLNQSNEADRRVYELLSEKFKLFEGVFGASDEVLGAIESGVDFEKRIAGIYQRCRTPGEISASFDALQRELDAQINEAMTRTRQQLLENFDDEVREKLRVQNENSKTCQTRFEKMLMQLTQYELDGHAEFEGEFAFRLKSCPFGDGIPLGLYELPRRSGEAHLYRLGHPLAEKVLAQASGRELPAAEVAFDYSGYAGTVSVVEPFVGKSGWLRMSLFSIESLAQSEDHLILAGVTDEGEPLDEEILRRFFSLSASTTPLPPGEGPGVRENRPLPPRQGNTWGGAEGRGEGQANDRAALLESLTLSRQESIRRTISERNAGFFEVEAEKLEGWAEDLKLGLEREIKELDRQIKETRRATTTAPTLEQKLAGQKQIKALEAQRSQKRRALFEAQDEIDRRREKLIAEIEGKLQQRITQNALFSIRWVLA
jgi:adenine-specific DNA-methyltransferase